MTPNLDRDHFMALAIEEARRGAGFVSPNPLVGCVIVSREGRMIGSGAHLKFGGPHAEAHALQPFLEKNEVESLRDATLFVTLEPCAHEGKTPSCAKAIAKLPIREVIFGLVDPNPLVAGAGQKIVRDAGIACEEYRGPLRQQLENLAEHFLVNQRLRRPFISLKVATSMDGQLAMKSGESQWITGEPARLEAHRLRATHEALLIGQGTLDHDDPSLDIRHPHFPGKSNKVIVLLGDGAPPDLRSLRLLKNHAAEDVHFLKRAGQGNWRRLILQRTPSLALVEGPEIYDPWFRDVQNPEDSRKWLAHSILVEGGARVLSSFINQVQWDRLYIFQAPLLIGAKNGKPWTELVNIENLAHKIRLKTDLLTPIGDDFLWTGRPVKEPL